MARKDLPSFDPVNWSEAIKVDPDAARFPMPSREQLESLRDDIIHNGPQQRIVLWTRRKRASFKRTNAFDQAKRGNIRLYLIEGRSRLAAISSISDERKREEILRDLFRNARIISLPYHSDPLHQIAVFNLHRVFTSQQKKELLAKLIKAHPFRADGDLARFAKSTGEGPALLGNQYKIRGSSGSDFKATHVAQNLLIRAADNV